MSIQIIVAACSIVVAIFTYLNDNKAICIVSVLLALSVLLSEYVTYGPPPVELYPTDGAVSQDGEVTLKTEPASEIYYTLRPDADPKTDGILYEGPIVIKKSTVLNAKSKSWGKWSPLSTWTLQVTKSGAVVSEEAEGPLQGPEIIDIEAHCLKSTIKAGDSLTRKDFRVTGLHADGTETRLYDFSIDQSELSDSGDHKVRITYDSFSDECDVTVIELISIEAEFLEETVDIEDTLTNNMFKVYGTFSDGSEETINGFDVFPREFSETGEHDVTIDFEGKRVSCTVTVTASQPKEPEGIVAMLAESVLKDSGTFKTYLGSETINVYAEDQHDAFSINTGASYNLWGNGEQEVSFRINKLGLSTLRFTICGETGTSGSATVSIFLDRPADDETPDYTFELEDAPYPLEAEIDVKGRDTMAIHVSNHAGHENRIAFYNFEGTQ